VATVVVWHIYHMVFDPESYPMNWSWITGRITEEDFKERHTLEYLQELKEKGETDTVEPGSPKEPPKA
jgi:hypothetical protein